MSRWNKRNRWRHDADYLSKLSPQEREWYELFIRNFYLSGKGPFSQPNPRHPNQKTWTLGGLSENLANDDAMGFSTSLSKAFPDEEENSTEDLLAYPDYLNPFTTEEDTNND